MIKTIRSIIKSTILNLHYNSFRLSFLSVTSITSKNSKADRLSFDSYTVDKIKKQLERRENLPSVSAVYRVKNGAEYIESSILSIAPFAKEIIIVDNDSTDNTLAVVNSLAKKLKKTNKFVITKYEKKLAIAGKGYKEQVDKDNDKSLATFYNYCFSLATCDYVIKTDAHCIFSPYGIDTLQDTIKKEYEGVIFRGLEIYGKWLHLELSLYKRSLDFRYLDDELYERLIFNKKIKAKRIIKPIFLHIKRLSYIKDIDHEISPIFNKYK
ncbi:glycosyltransferase family 2 protein [Xenorhabdus sp. 42]|uniref:glycosyltransferase family 2 protein n=1 Tax=Xenorhabdus szentirmaii TaxID=290112 RepID=UPI00199DF5D9|nr:glycosyltransferase family A protein [Xenorhabdus sp. 42]MBD2820342.1 glycosyltransferase family 2 protein [Xenorhabdus sp. 42]